MSAYAFVHTATLSFATFALVNMQFDLRLANPVIPSWRIDESALCRDIDAGLGWDDNWLAKCSRSFSMVKMYVACFGLILMVAQWWALITVRIWGREVRVQQQAERPDAEKASITYEGDAANDEKHGL